MATQVYIYANFVNTTLASPINNSVTSMTLTSSTNLPTVAAGQIFVMVLLDAATQTVREIVHVTAITGAVCTIVRGQDGTSAQSWLAGDFAYAPPTREILNALAGGGSVGGNGWVLLGNGLYFQWQTLATQLIDGSAAIPVTFPTAFPTACIGVWPSVQNNYQTNPWPLGVAYDTATTTGCNINVWGAPTPPGGQTGTVTYFALGY